MRRKKAPDGRGLQNLFMEIFMSLSIVFQNHSVRNVFENEKFWFCAKDVCKVLEIRNSREAVADVPESYKRTYQIVDTMNRTQLANCVSEEGVFILMLKTGRIDALSFQKRLFELLGGENALDLMMTNVAFLSNKRQDTYVMLNHDTNLIKIGKSCDVDRRRNTLETQSGSRIEVIKIFPTDIEAELHRKFDAYRVRGEWFNFPNEVLQELVCQ